MNGIMMQSDEKWAVELTSFKCDWLEKKALGEADMKSGQLFRISKAAFNRRTVAQDTWSIPKRLLGWK